MIAHSNIALERLVRRAQLLRPPIQLRLAQRTDDFVRHGSGWHPDLRRNRLLDKGIHRLIAQLREHKRGFAIVRSDVAVGKRVERGKK